MAVLQPAAGLVTSVAIGDGQAIYEVRTGDPLYRQVRQQSRPDPRRDQRRGEPAVRVPDDGDVRGAG